MADIAAARQAVEYIVHVHVVLFWAKIYRVLGILLPVLLVQCSLLRFWVHR